MSYRPQMAFPVIATAVVTPVAGVCHVMGARLHILTQFAQLAASMQGHGFNLKRLRINAVESFDDFFASSPRKSCQCVLIDHLLIDHLLYEINSGFWRWVTRGRGNVLSIGVVVIDTRPQPKRLLGLRQP